MKTFVKIFFFNDLQSLERILLFLFCSDIGYLEGMSPNPNELGMSQRLKSSIR